MVTWYVNVINSKQILQKITLRLPILVNSISIYFKENTRKNLNYWPIRYHPSAFWRIHRVHLVPFLILDELLEHCLLFRLRLGIYTWDAEINGLQAVQDVALVFISDAYANSKLDRSPRYTLESSHQACASSSKLRPPDLSTSTWLSAPGSWRILEKL
jgi:hypothetical protein